MKKYNFVEVLKYINRVPFRVTAKIYSASPRELDLGVLFSSASGWDAMYTEHPSYRIPADRETWLKEMKDKKDGQDSGIQERVKDIVALLRMEGAKKIYSVGSGGGY